MEKLLRFGELLTFFGVFWLLYTSIEWIHLSSGISAFILTICGIAITIVAVVRSILKEKVILSIATEIILIAVIATTICILSGLITYFGQAVRSIPAKTLGLEHVLRAAAILAGIFGVGALVGESKILRAPTAMLCCGVVQLFFLSTVIMSIIQHPATCWIFELAVVISMISVVILIVELKLKMRVIEPDRRRRLRPLQEVRRVIR